MPLLLGVLLELDVLDAVELREDDELLVDVDELVVLLLGVLLEQACLTQ